MQITVEPKPYAALETEALVSYVFEESEPVQGRIAEFDQFSNGLLKKARLEWRKRTDRQDSGNS